MNIQPYMLEDGPVLSAVNGKNDELLYRACLLYVRPGDKVLDMTYGRGAFWKSVDTGKINLVRNDIAADLGDVTFDFRELPDAWTDEFDVVVLDPPYMHSSKYKSVKKSVDAGYRNNTSEGAGSTESVGEFYKSGMEEAWRILKHGGILMVKCMDQIESGKQKRLHIWIHNYAIGINMVDEDLFILVQDNVPTMRWKHQYHSRKNFSYLWVFRK